MIDLTPYTSPPALIGAVAGGLIGAGVALRGLLWLQERTGRKSDARDALAAWQRVQADFDRRIAEAQRDHKATRPIQAERAAFTLERIKGAARAR